jgi:ABC-type glutathione transport system ATPase component
MAEPILSVRDLHTHFFQDEGVVRAVDGTSFDLFAGRTLGIVGESGCGKSVTARSILRIVERPGRIVSGEILLRRADGRSVDLVKLASDSADMRAIRGGEIGLVFQEPMSSLSAFTPSAINSSRRSACTPNCRSARRGRGRSSCWRWSASHVPHSAWTHIRSSSRAGCASV